MELIKKENVNVQLGLLSVKNFKGTVNPSNFDATVHQIREKIIQNYGGLSRNQLKKKDPIKTYATYYKKFGYSYHVLGQLESFLKGDKQLEIEIPLLKVLMLTELESMLLMACHDMDKIELPLSVEKGESEDELQYVGIGDRPQKIIETDFFIRDGQGIISSILKGPDHRTRISPKTENALFVIYGPNSLEPLESLESHIKQALDTLENLLKICSPECTIEEKSHRDM